jgi:hypothetical protein
MTVMGMRCETPERLSTRLSVRGLERDALDDLAHELGDAHGRAASSPPARRASTPPARDRHPELDLLGVVRHDLAADAVLERRDDLAARGVVLGVGREAEEHVERQADGVALNLDVALLHDVEQPHLHLAGEVGELVEGEDAAVGARQHAVLDGQLVAQQVPAARRLDRVDVADDVGDGHVGRGELLDEALVAADPRDGRVVAALGEPRCGRLADRAERVVVDLAAGDHRHLGVEQRDEGAQDAALRLPRRPSRMKLCRDSRALTICGITVSS